jgi:hypothetical protein
MAKIRKMFVGIFLLATVGGLAYYTYGYINAENRVREICFQIKPGMSRAELKTFGSEHGLRSNPPDAGIYYMAETRTFGRYACKVVLDQGVVKQAEYDFAD